MQNRYLIICFLLLVQSECFGACDCGSTDSNNPCTGQSISITVAAGTPNGGSAVDNIYNWSFSSGGKDARCGQFANGDYWIAPADGETTVTVSGITSTSHPSLISADENPSPEVIGLLSGAKNYGNYSSAENIIPNLPKVYSSTTSIVAAIQRNEAIEGACGTSAILGECADSYNVLTVLPAVPDKAGSETLRPNVTGTEKELLPLSDFDFTRIPRKTFLSGTDATGLDSITRRWSHSIETLGLHTSARGGAEASEGGRAFRSHILIDDYGGGTTVAWYNDLMNLFSDDHTEQEKLRPLAAMLSYGLNLYHAIYTPPDGVVRHWGSGATQHPGKFMPAVLLAALAKDSKYKNNVKTASAHLRDQVYSGPLELAQVHMGANGPVWGDIQSFTDSTLKFLGSYWGELLKSQCYDTAPDMETFDYYRTGEWKTFSIPIGTLTSGTGMHFTFVSEPTAWTLAGGDLKIRNVTLDGVAINFNAVTLNNYHNGTASGTISEDGTEYSIQTGTIVKKTSTETYTVTANSVLNFEWYQNEIGTLHGIGFESNSIFDDEDQLVQISGTWNAPYMHQRGCLVATGPKNMYDPHGYIDGPPNKAGAGYLPSSLGVQRSMVATMFLMPEVCDVINYDPLVQYVDRTTQHGIQAGNDPCVTPDIREDFTTCLPYEGGKNCLYYGVTWGPQDPADPSSQCITTPTPPYTKAGRFTWLDGTRPPTTYNSGQVAENWEKIRGTSGSCHAPRRHFRNVRLHMEVEP